MFPRFRFPIIEASPRKANLYAFAFGPDAKSPAFYTEAETRTALAEIKPQEGAKYVQTFSETESHGFLLWRSFNSQLAPQKQIVTLMPGSVN